MHSASPRGHVKGCPPTASSQRWDLNRAILTSGLSPSARVLLLIIVDHAGHGRSRCTASTRTLACESGLTDRHVRRLLRGLEAAAWIRIERATGSRHSRHTLVLGAACRRTSRLHEVGHFRPCRRTSEVHEVGHPSPTNGSLTAHQNGARGTLQNFNPPTPALPDDNPARTAAMLSDPQGWRGWLPSRP